jgi:hypothetical protein
MPAASSSGIFGETTVRVCLLATLFCANLALSVLFASCTMTLYAPRRLAFEPYSCSTCTVKVLPTERTVFQTMLTAAGGDTKPEVAQTIRVCTYDVLQALRAAHPYVQVRLLHRIITYC